MKIDMSPKAITARLKQASELRDLCIALGGERLKERLRKEYTKGRIYRTEDECKSR